MPQSAMVSTTRCDQLRDAGLALGRAQLAVEILAGDDVGGGLRPVGRHFDVALLENHRAFIIADGGGAQFPVDLVVRGLSRLQLAGEVAGEGDAPPFFSPQASDAARRLLR